MQTIVENKNEEIFCHVMGNPKPVVIWSFNEKQVGKKKQFHFILHIFLFFPHHRHYQKVRKEAKK